MKRKLFPIFFPLLIILSSNACSKDATPENPEDVFVANEFTHPGILHHNKDLNFIKEKVANKQEPWYEAYELLLSWKGSSLDWTATPFENVHRDSYGANKVGDPAISNDGEAAYSHALQWVITGNVAHAEKSIEILNAWANTLQSITGEDDNLLAGMTAQKYCNAAEIIRYTYNGWPKNEIELFENTLLTVFYPLISNFYTNSMHSNGNWGLSMVNSVMAIGVFCNDTAMFNGAVAHVMRTSFQPYSTLSGYIDSVSGQCQESGRDQGHTHMGLCYLVSSCEIAWKQGIDLYAYLDNRLLHGMEYTARYNLGHDAPYYNMYYKFDWIISDKGRGNFAPIYERVYHHYVKRRNLSMPYSEQVVNQNRPEGFTSSMTSWGTLTSYKGN